MTKNPLTLVPLNNIVIIVDESLNDISCAILYADFKQDSYEIIESGFITSNALREMQLKYKARVYMDVYSLTSPLAKLARTYGWIITDPKDCAFPFISFICGIAKKYRG